MAISQKYVFAYGFYCILYLFIIGEDEMRRSFAGNSIISEGDITENQFNYRSDFITVDVRSLAHRQDPQTKCPLYAGIDLAKAVKRGGPPCIFEQYLFDVVLRMP